MCCLPTPNHRKLVQDCYPPSKRIAGVENPSSNELGKLVYYAQRKPAKLTKVGTLLEERAATDSRSLTGSGAAKEKARCGLMITIAILKSLICECPRDVTYISKSAQLIITHTLRASTQSGHAGQRDLELAARASSTFFAFTNALDPARNSVEGDLGKSYLGLLSNFSQMVTEKSSADQEDQNRAKLIGLGALSAAASSDVLYTSAFSTQVSIIVPALLDIVQAKSVPLENLQAEAQKIIAGTPTYTLFSSLAKKRPSHRKTPSLSAHVAGEKGPDSGEVVSAALGILHGLFKTSDALQIQETIKAVLQWMDGAKSGQSQWRNESWACFLGTTLVRWTALQYRFVVLTAFLEFLVESCEGQALFKHGTLCDMIAAILRSKDLILIGLSTSDALNNLIGLLIRRVHYDIKDPLLPQLVTCIESLAVHIYYADQLSDAAEELVARIVALTRPDTDTAAAEATTRMSHLPTKSAAAVKAGEEQKMESIRITLFALTRLIIVANSDEGNGDKVQQGTEKKSEEVVKEKGKAAGPSLGITLAGTRSRIQPDTLQPLTALLAWQDYAVRLATAQLFISYLQLEAQEPSASASEAASFLHGLSAAAHVCALSKSLRLPAGTPTSISDLPLGRLVLLERANQGGTVSIKDQSEAAIPLDYAALVAVFNAATDRLAGAALLAVVPALLDIDQTAARALVAESTSRSSLTQRRQITRLFLAKVWMGIAEKWAVPSVLKEAESVLSAMSDDILPSVPEPTKGLTLADDAVSFPELGEDASAGEGSAAASAVFDRSKIIKGLASSSAVQANTGLSAEALTKWFGRDWSVSIAIDDSDVGASPYFETGLEAQSGNGGTDKALRLTFETASGGGASSTDVNGNGQHHVGVDDFRQALGSRSGGGAGGGRSVKTNREGKSAVPSSSLQGVDLQIPGLRSSSGRVSPNKGRMLQHTNSYANRSNGDNASLSESLSSVPINGPMSASERRASRRASRQAAPPSGGGETNGFSVSHVITGNGEGGSGRVSAQNSNGGGVAGLLNSLGIAEENPSSSFGGADGRKQVTSSPMVPPHAA